jgi:hypothetical protein
MTWHNDAARIANKSSGRQHTARLFDELAISSRRAFGMRMDVVTRLTAKGGSATEW